MKNCNGSPKWIAGRVSKQRSSITDDSAQHGAKVNRHVDHLRLHEMEGENNAGVATPKKGKQ